MARAGAWLDANKRRIVGGKLADARIEAVNENLIESQIGNQGDRVRLAFKIFDTEGVDFVRLFADGASGMQKMAQEAEAAGAVISTKVTREAAKLADQMAKVHSLANMFEFSRSFNNYIKF